MSTKRRYGPSIKDRILSAKTVANAEELYVATTTSSAYTPSRSTKNAWAKALDKRRAREQGA